MLVHLKNVEDAWWHMYMSYMHNKESCGMTNKYALPQTFSDFPGPPNTL